MWWLIIPTVSLTTALLLGRVLERVAAEQTRPATRGVPSGAAEISARELA